MNLLSFTSIWEFLLRYTVIIGIVVAIIGVSICMLAKSIACAVRKTKKVNPDDKLYSRLLVIGLVLVLIAMIVMVLPFSGTFYRG